MIRRPPRSTLFPTRRSSDLMEEPHYLCGVAAGSMTKTGKIGFIGSKPVYLDRKSTRLNSSHLVISYAVFCLKKKKKTMNLRQSDVILPKEHQTRHPTCHMEA